MRCLITAFMRSANKTTTRKNKISKSKKLTAKTQYLNVKARSKQPQKTIRQNLKFTNFPLP